MPMSHEAAGTMVHDVASMSVFDFDHAEAAADLAENGWIHRPAGISPALMAALRAETEAFLTGDGHDLSTWRFPGKKAQFLWELPDGLTLRQLKNEVAAVTGMDPDRVTLSERHVKVYSPEADDFPPPHKDRGASTFTLGFAIRVPDDSRLVLWPNVDTSFNFYPTSAEWRDSRPTADLPENVIEGIEPVTVDMRPGDFVAFRGAEIYHERFRPASTAVLYLKFNEIGLDPLGEDPDTTAMLEHTADLRASGQVDAASLSISPLVVGLRTEEFFPGGQLHVQARFVDGSCAAGIDEAAVGLMRRVMRAGSVPVALLEGDDRDAALDLLERGVLVLRL